MSDFMKVDAARLDRAAGQGAGASAPPASGDVDAFQRAMERPHERDGGDSGHPGGKAENADESSDETRDEGAGNRSFASMSSPLDTLFAGRMEAASVAPRAEAASPADLDGLAEKLVDRILVSQPGEGAGEVRIRLGGDVLPGTEITLTRGADGLLAVRLATTDAASFQTLVGAQDSLKARLGQLEKDVRVDVVSERGGSEAENNDARRQSRGFYVAPDDAV